MSKIKNEWPTQMREALIYRNAMASAAKKSALNAMEFEKRGIPYEEVYRATSASWQPKTPRTSVPT